VARAGLVSTALRDRRISGSLIRYALIGASGVLLDYCLFLLLFNVFGLHDQVSNVISTTTGIVNNFTLNTLLNFRKRDRILLRFLRFYSVGVGGIALTFVLLRVFSGLLGVNPNLVKACSLPIVLLFQYSINKRWSFA
jgi:putative flippase GtrA